ncbi:hypothetical protein HOLleu_18911 [Holothuria leucospilota]|uniref:Uncharacterized protein n=1 Tax=Holothuria leucospilota TaxID=206669 RepID=A0A9Q1C4A2_HOLLE|nr:hypothetical protein HOLleu_18911 [Holothuria leucospilota]
MCNFDKTNLSNDPGSKKVTVPNGMKDVEHVQENLMTSISFMTHTCKWESQGKCVRDQPEVQRWPYLEYLTALGSPLPQTPQTPREKTKQETKQETQEEIKHDTEQKWRRRHPWEVVVEGRKQRRFHGRIRANGQQSRYLK